MGFLDAQGKLRLLVGINSDREPIVAFRDKNGENRGGLGVQPDGTAGILFRDQSGASRIGFSVHADGACSLTILGRDRNPIAELGASKTDESYINLYDKHYRSLLEMRPRD